MTAMVEPLPLDKIGVDATYYGVKITGVGGEDRIVAFTHDRHDVVAAVRRFVPEQWGEQILQMRIGEPLWWQVVDHTNCTDPDCEVESWSGVECAGDAPGAVPVLVIEVDSQ